MDQQERTWTSGTHTDQTTILAVITVIVIIMGGFSSVSKRLNYKNVFICVNFKIPFLMLDDGHVKHMYFLVQFGLHQTNVFLDLDPYSVTTYIRSV